MFGIKYFNFFSDGQSIATRLSKQVNHITKSVKKDIETYNNDDHGMVRQESLPLTMNFDEIKDPDSSFWLTVRSTDVESHERHFSVPMNVKRKAIDLCNLLDRAKEEQVLLKEEMRNVFSYYQQQHDMISDFICATNNSPIVDDIQFGELLFCRRKLLHVEYRLQKVKETFLPYIEFEMPRMIIITEQESSDEDVLEEDEEEIVLINPLTEGSYSEYECESDEEFLSDDIFL